MSRRLDTSAWLAGVAGALAMTAAHETARDIIPQAPRLDSLGRRALAQLWNALDQDQPGGDTMQAVALMGDVAFNTGLFAGAVGLGPPRLAPVRGLAVGSLAGLATLAVPPWLGIGPGPTKLPTRTRVMTLALYAGGGLMAGLTYRRLRGDGGS